MSKEREEADTFFETYRAHLNQVDDLVHVVLNAHADVEATLDSFLRVGFYYPEHLEDARLTYVQKAHIARVHGTDERSQRMETDRHPQLATE